MPRRRRTATSSVLNPNLTPLLDVVLQLITFFMMLVHFGTRLEGATKAVRLPVAPAALPGSDLTFDRLNVSMDAQGRLLVQGKALEEEAASKWWADQAKIRRAGLETLGDPGAARDDLPTVVIVRADKATSYGALRRALAEAQDKGFAHFSLVVLRRQGQ
jgi:biopolymer transport protein ExbD